jgi:secreted trypsin-like serine protease
MVRSILHRAVFFVMVAVASTPLPVCGAEVGGQPDAASSPDGSANPARDYVRERVAEVTLRASRSTPAAASAIDPRIVGGVPASPDSNPFQVGLLIKVRTDDFLAQYCAGTLVKKRFVVTAAHCSDFVLESEVQVLAHTQWLDGSGDRHDVKRITIHPAWNPETFDNDIAVWELATPVLDIRPARIGRLDPPAGTELLATGWGATEFGFPLQLMEVRVPLVDRTDCNDADSYAGSITANMICAGLREGGKDTCQGDSGGPLVQTRSNGHPRLVGITSWGNGCALPSFYGVYTRVSRYTAFVESVIHFRFNP